MAKATSYKEILTINVCLVAVCRLSVSYTIDEGTVTIFKGPVGSYFGYSVGILSNIDGTWILVGAPRDNNTKLPDTVRPGQVYKCSIEEQNKPCLPVTVNTAGNIEETITYHNKRVTFHSDRNDQWLGMTLDIEPSNHSSLTICAPRWEDSYLEKKMSGMSHMNGICYILDPSLRKPATLLPALTNLRRLVNRESYVEFSMGGMGFSVQYSKENGILLFGAPGLNDWSGGIVIETPTVDHDIRYIEPARSNYQDSYNGYAITTGRFINRNHYSIASGAPRAKNHGQVLLYSSKTIKVPLLTIDGTQPGSYFGASLCSVSMENDLLDYIVVGAPMFAGEKPEEGRVFVFKAHGLVGFGQTSVLKGSQHAYGRFGSAVVNVGDLDKDGYEDIAIGAPFEDSGSGAVYIYNGYKLGIWGQYTQRVPAASINVGLRTFGHTFSRPYDVDKNGLTDIAVGAYESDQVVLLKSVPLVDLSETTLEIKDIKPLNGYISNGQYKQNSTYYHLLTGNLIFCLIYQSKNLDVPNSLDMKYEIVFDTSRNVSRVYHANKNGILTNEDRSLGHRKLHLNRRACENTTIFVQYREDIDEDVLIDLKYSITERAVRARQFNGAKVKPEILHTRRVKIELDPKCGERKTCKNDFIINASLNVPGQKEIVYVIGQSNNVITTVNISNIKSTKYLTVEVVYSQILSFKKIISDVRNASLPCSVVSSKLSDFIVTCNVIRNTEALYDLEDNMSLQFEFYVLHKQPSEAHFDINVYSSQKTSRHIYLHLLIVQQSNIVVIGKGTPETLVFRRNDHTDVTDNLLKFVYFVYNEGPSALNNGNIFISYPEIPGVLEMKGLQIESSHEGITKYNCRLRTRGKVRSELVSYIDSKEDILLVCDGDYSYCTTIICRLENIETRGSISLNIKMKLQVKGNKFQNLKKVKLGSMSIFQNKSAQPDFDHLLLFSTEKTKIFIDIYNMYNDNEINNVKIWIVLISAAGGTAIFLIISLFMFRVGFFRRLENEDLKLYRANWKLRMSDTQHYQNQNVILRRFHQIHVNNLSFNAEVDDEETDVLIPFSNGTSSIGDTNSASSSSLEDTEYLEPVKTRQMRVFLK